ncbi:hypothetical protein [Modestobacter altitudinis]|uniref:hypothetical protein n=1 Tax=Modestobacter altitudinis TaxID=2213158 RepID=UPI00110CE046|nr:hypothetical protein [Modestobacter altitudinis]
MSSFFGGVRGREDPELAAGNRRTRLHYARDVNDQRALADDTSPIRRSRNWTWFAVAAVVMAVLGFAGSRGAEEVPITADCDTPAIAVATSEVTAGQALRFRLTGPDDTGYVVTLDGAPVRGDAGSTVSYTQTAAGPALRLQQCLSPTLLLAAPAGDGPHELAVLRLAADGTTTQVAAATVQVSGTR